MILAIIALTLGSQAARARVYDTYRADYFKGAFCSAVGGACAADGDTVTGLFQNPAALANGEARWDFDGDYASRTPIEPGVSSQGDFQEAVTVGGIGYSPGKWGVGVSFFARNINVHAQTLVADDSGNSQNAVLSGKASSYLIRIPFAYYLGEGNSVGLTLSMQWYHQELEVSVPHQLVGTDPTDLRYGLTLGALFSLAPKWRAGSWLRFGVSDGDSISFLSENTGATSFREDFVLHYPWIWATGLEFDPSPTWQIFLENDIIGDTYHGFLLSYRSFSNGAGTASPLEKGRKIAFEPHTGARVALNQKLRLHFGSYYENARRESIVGRIHGTGGVSYDFPKIVELIVGVDVSNKYKQLIFTFR